MSWIKILHGKYSTQLLRTIFFIVTLQSATHNFVSRLPVWPSPTHCGLLRSKVSRHPISPPRSTNECCLRGHWGPPTCLIQENENQTVTGITGILSDGSREDSDIQVRQQTWLWASTQESLWFFFLFLLVSFSHGWVIYSLCLNSQPCMSSFWFSKVWDRIWHTIVAQYMFLEQRTQSRVHRV